jgi:SAM-dependent methyltransferase
MDRQAQQFWDAYWPQQIPTATARTMTQILDRIKCEYLRAILPGTGDTLEVGAGSGRLSCLLAMEGYHTVCLDFSRPALEAARMNYAAAHVQGWFVNGDAFSLPFSDDRFNVVLSTGLLEHFENPAPVAREMTRVLRPEGLFYSDIVPSKFSLFRSLDWLGALKRTLAGGREKSKALYERSFTESQVRDLLSAVGLEQITVFPAGVIPPYLPLLYRHPKLRAMQVSLVDETQRLWKRRDGTRLAAWLGFYYFAWGRKR